MLSVHIQKNTNKQINVNKHKAKECLDECKTTQNIRLNVIIF